MRVEVAMSMAAEVETHCGGHATIIHIGCMILGTAIRTIRCGRLAPQDEIETKLVCN